VALMDALPDSSFRRPCRADAALIGPTLATGRWCSDVTVAHQLVAAHSEASNAHPRARLASASRCKWRVRNPVRAAIRNSSAANSWQLAAIEGTGGSLPPPSLAALIAHPVPPPALRIEALPGAHTDSRRAIQPSIRAGITVIICYALTPKDSPASSCRASNAPAPTRQRSTRCVSRRDHRATTAVFTPRSPHNPTIRVVHDRSPR
jgi:hypothetical protein